MFDPFDRSKGLCEPPFPSPTPQPDPTAPADPILALAFLAVIIHGIVNSEVALAKELQEKAPLMGEDGVWRGGGPGQAAETRCVL